MAVALRRSREDIDAAAASWPEVRSGLNGSATLLRATRDQLDQVVEHRAEYEAAREQVAGLSGEFAELLPVLTEGLDARLDREDRELVEMGRGPGPGARGTADLRDGAGAGPVHRALLAWLVAAVAGLHGVLLVLGGLPARRGPGSRSVRRRHSGTAGQLRRLIPGTK